MLETYVLERPVGAEEQWNNRDSFSLDKMFELLGKPKRVKWNIEFTQDCLYNKSQEPFLEGLPKQDFVVLNSSGHFHHRTYFLLRHLEKNVEYVHIDAHPDLWGFEGGFGGHTFVSEILKLPLVSKAWLFWIIPNEKLIPPVEYVGNPKIIARKVKLLLGEKLERLIDQKSGGKYQELYDKSSELFKESLSYKEGDSLSGKNIYLSIDLDVLHNFPSDWKSHGRLSMAGLIKTIDLLKSKSNILGADICGLDINHFPKKSDLKKIKIIHDKLTE